MTKAYTAILLSLTDEVLWKVADQTTIVGLWERPCDKYENNSPA